jgi:hypothetical protein
MDVLFPIRGLTRPEMPSVHHESTLSLSCRARLAAAADTTRDVLSVS